MFDVLVQDDKLRHFFEERRSRLRRKEVSKTKLPFGVQIRYLFPHGTEELDAVAFALGQSGIANLAFLDKEESKMMPLLGFWKVVADEPGFALTSPIGTSLEPIEAAINVMKDFGARPDPEWTLFRVSIDARHRTLNEIRSVYKNFLVVEKALDEIRHLRYRGSKSTSLVMQFLSVEDAFAKLDACDNLKCLRTTANPEQGAYYYLLTLRRDNKAMQHLAAIDRSSQDELPLRFEFRGQTSEVDSDFCVAWIQLLQSLVHESFLGTVLDARERTVDEAWLALFDVLVRDDTLRQLFNQLRNRLNQKQEISRAILDK
jgi:hypothetical protein